MKAERAGQASPVAAALQARAGRAGGLTGAIPRASVAYALVGGSVVSCPVATLDVPSRGQDHWKSINNQGGYEEF